VLTRALLPFAIERLVEIIPNLVEHLDRMDSRHRARQRDAFRKNRRGRLSGTVAVNC